VPIKAPVIMGVALIGYEIDRPFLQKLSTLVEQDLTITANDLGDHLGSDRYQFSSSTLDHRELSYSEFVPYAKLHPLQILTRNSSTFVTVTKSVYQGDVFNVQLTLLQSIDKIFLEIINLLGTMLIIALIALSTSCVLVVIFSRRISQPLNELIGRVEEVSRGNYDSYHEPCDSTAAEIKQLDEAFGLMRRRIHEREQHIAYQANHDSLTGLFNRQKISHIMGQMLETQKTYILYQFNVVNLRNIFDTFGYQKGEKFLQEVSKRILSLGGVGARINGGEFIWIPPRNSGSEVNAVSDNIAINIGTAYAVDDQEIDVRFAVSSIRIPEQALTPSWRIARPTGTLRTVSKLPAELRKNVTSLI
jgi:diguanylate cyclase (GGDEF)-like protein